FSCAMATIVRRHATAATAAPRLLVNGGSPWRPSVSPTGRTGLSKDVSCLSLNCLLPDNPQLQSARLHEEDHDAHATTLSTHVIGRRFSVHRRAGDGPAGRQRRPRKSEGDDSGDSVRVG